MRAFGSSGTGRVPRGKRWSNAAGRTDTSVIAVPSHRHVLADIQIRLERRQNGGTNWIKRNGRKRGENYEFHTGNKLSTERSTGIPLVIQQSARDKNG
jgi:hypothetical protein